MLRSIYDDVSWDPLRFTRVPQHYWSSIENQRSFLHRLGEKLGVSDKDGWYKVTTKMVVDNGGSGLLRRYNDSISAMLGAVYPRTEWDSLKFTKAPQKYWSSLTNQRAFMDSLAKKLEFKDDHNAWYKVTTQILYDNGAKPLLRRYDDSVLSLLVAVYPEFTWDPLKFVKAPQSYWMSVDNQRSFMDTLAKKLGFKEGDTAAWYNVSHQTLHENGGASLLDQYGGSLPDLLAKVYPHFEWQMWRFPRRTGRVRSDPDGLQSLLASVEQSLAIKTPRDWYRVTKEQLESLRVHAIFNKRSGDLLRVLKERYPDEVWDAASFITKKRQQKVDPLKEKPLS